MNLEDQIIELLQAGKPLKAKEIALMLNSEEGQTIDKSQINSLLYSGLGNKVVQNKEYQWTLKDDDKKPVELPLTKDKKSPLNKLSYYYLECLSKDMNSGISVFADSKYNKEYSLCKTFPASENNTETIDSHLVAKVKKDKNNYLFKLGYPQYIRKGKSKSGVDLFFTEPLFLFTVDTEHALLTGCIKLTDDDPVINSRALESITGIDTSAELLMEMVDLYEDLGINNELENKPTLEDLFQRLQKIKSEWNWVESIDINQLTEMSIASIKAVGIYNAAAVFIGEKSKFTVGLEKDLNDLSQIAEVQYQKTALGDWINNSIEEVAIRDTILIEPIPLNDEQRVAIKKGLSAKLTVVTGPPGTGKSQVVTSLIVNAVYQGQTVLFSSKNNKAVDVVNERVNALTNRQIMLRLGAQFQTTLSEYLSGLLSASPSEDDNLRYKASAEIHKKLGVETEIVNKKIEAFIQLRNKVDLQEAKLEELREDVGADFFAGCKFLSLEKLDQVQSIIKKVKIDLGRSNKNIQPFFTKLFWSFFRKERFQVAQKNIELLEKGLDNLNVLKPLASIDDLNVDAYEAYVVAVNIKIIKAREIKEYFQSLSTLNTTEDLFQLTKNLKDISDSIVNNSLELWNNWLQLLSDKMSKDDRKIVGDYINVLNLIVSADNSKQSIDRGVWSQYYSFLPKIMHILSCWAVTSLSARGRVPLEPAFFDFVIIDEASQCDIASVLPLLYRAKRAVIIGDNKQLTHISAISETQDIQLLKKYDLTGNYMGWSYAVTSLFQLASSLCTASNIVVLKDHHRSHADIINYSNKVFYDRALRVATKYENLKTIKGEPAVRWIDVKGVCVRPDNGGAYNDAEATRVVEGLQRLVANGYKGTIGVVTPFSAQYKKILDKVNDKKDLADRLLLRDFLCDTVHKFQGDERDIIIFSPVVSEGVKDGALSFLKKTGNLFNVAITRARAMLIVVGDNKACHQSGVKHYKGFVEYVKTLEERNEGLVDKDILKDWGPKYPKFESKVMISHWEKIFYERLHKEGIATTPQFKVGQYSLDLALFDDQRKLNIEIDGEQYHRNWDGELLRRDQLRNKRLIELGWDVQRFWVYQIRDNMNGCIEKIKAWQNLN